MFAVLEEEVARDEGDPDVHWVGCFGYASRTDLPARPWETGPDAIWMRCRSPLLFDHDRVLERSFGKPPQQSTEAPDWYAAAFAQVQEQLHAGNTYEVNLTYREDAGNGRDPLETYLRLRAANPAPYAGLLSHRGTHLLSSSPERYATVDRHRTQILDMHPTSTISLWHLDGNGTDVVGGATLVPSGAAGQSASPLCLAAFPNGVCGAYRWRGRYAFTDDRLEGDLRGRIPVVCPAGPAHGPGL